MFLYATLGSIDLSRAIPFYDAVMAVLHQPRLPDWSDGWAGWGSDYDTGVGLWICEAFNGEAATAGNGTMLAFKATSAEQVRAFHHVGLAHGGQDDGAPGIREMYGPAFFVAYLRDLDGNKLACVFHRYEEKAQTALDN